MENTPDTRFELLKAIADGFGADVQLVQTGKSTYKLKSINFPDSRPTIIQSEGNSVRIDIQDGLMLGYATRIASYYTALGMTPRVFYDGSLVNLCQTESAGIETMLALEKERKRGVVDI